MEKDIIKKVLNLSDLEKLNPVQEKAVKAGLFEDKNLVVAAPTASGKTMVAEMVALKTIKQGKKVVYIVPLRALASEKYEEFKRKYAPLGIKVAISIGDLDRSDPWLSDYDFVIATSEKLDSLLRHGIPWINQIGLVVADEIHLLDSPDRGPTLEIVLTRLSQVANPTILALSATISNHEELAEWLRANHMKSEWRPVKLYSGICFDGKLNFIPNKTMKIDKKQSPLFELVHRTLSRKKQALVFINTRKGAESAAESVGKEIKTKLKPGELEALSELSDKILHILEYPTRQCERLSRCIKMGTAFHHAGLTNKQRSLIEDSFKSGLIKTICATPTLAAGINLPAYRVIIRDLKRFSSFRGMDYIPVLEIQQMCGRAGRPQFDKEGEAILLPKNRAEAEYAWENYINGKPEKIYSKLGVEPVLRTHVLALIASEVTRTKKELFDFFSKTFYAYQYRDMPRLNAILENVLNQLEGFKFISTADSEKMDTEFRTAASLIQKKDSVLKPTRIGKRVSELYIDPLTANYLIKNLDMARERGITDFGLLHTISSTIEMKPLLSLRKSDFETINDIVAREEECLLEKPPNPWDLNYDEYLKSLKTAHMFRQWTEESGEDKLLEDFGITPGELRARLETADWLLYSAQELGLLLGHMNILKDIRKTRIRVKYGVKEELLPLIRLKGVGRVRARTLFNSGIQTMARLRKIPLQSLERIIGPKTARDIKDQLGELKAQSKSEHSRIVKGEAYEIAKNQK